MQLRNGQPLRQVEITAGCMLGYVKRVEPEALLAGRHPSLDQLSAVCEARLEFVACPQ